MTLLPELVELDLDWSCTHFTNEGRTPQHDQGPLGLCLGNYRGGGGGGGGRTVGYSLCATEPDQRVVGGESSLQILRTILH